jgi:hypothetical protein
MIIIGFDTICFVCYYNIYIDTYGEIDEIKEY